MSSKIVKGYLFAVFSAIIYGCMPLMSKYIYADGVNPLTLVFLRNIFSVLPLAILAYKQKGTLKVPGKLLPSIALISIFGSCLTPILLFSSYRFIPSGTATVFHFAYPAIVVIAEILFLRKKVQTGNIISMILCVIGIGLFYNPQQALNLAGSALALCSAVTFAMHVIMLSHFDSSKVSGFLFSFYVTVICSIISLAICLATNNLALPTTPLGWGLSVLFSLSVASGAVVLFQQSTFLIGGERTSILSTLEPITSVVIGLIVFHEPLGIPTLIGTVLVVAASALTALLDMKRKTKKA